VRRGGCARGNFGSRTARGLEIIIVLIAILVIGALFCGRAGFKMKSNKKKVAFPQRAWQINPGHARKRIAKKYSRPRAKQDF
jgi:hypothetical protein